MLLLLLLGVCAAAVDLSAMPSDWQAAYLQADLLYSPVSAVV